MSVPNCALLGAESVTCTVSFASSSVSGNSEIGIVCVSEPVDVNVSVPAASVKSEPLIAEPPETAYFTVTFLPAAGAAESCTAGRLIVVRADGSVAVAEALTKFTLGSVLVGSLS